MFSKSLTTSKDAKKIFLGENSIEAFRKIKEQSTKDLVIFGSPTIVGLLTDHDLIDEYYIFLVPILLGGGQRLLNNVQNVTKFHLLDLKPLDGVVVLYYSRLSIE